MKKTYEFENLGCAHCAGKMEEKIGKVILDTTCYQGKSFIYYEKNVS